MTYPGVNSLFSGPARDDGSEKWPDYAEAFWHVDCVRKIGLKAFTERYQAFCKRNGYNFQSGKPEELDPPGSTDCLCRSGSRNQ